ncbi:MAG: site-specific tyrosine recombinase/integron integrase [Exilispira sp.]
MKKRNISNSDNFQVLAEYTDYLFGEKNFSINTINSYKHDVYTFFEEINKNFKKIDEEDIIFFLFNIQKNDRSNATVARYYSSLSSFFEFLILKNYRKSNPISLIDYPKISKNLPDYLTYDEIKILFNSIESAKLDLFTKKRDLAIFEILYSCGLRVSECAYLKLSQINFEEKYLIVYGKGRKERLVPFGKNADQKLNDYLELRLKLSDVKTPFAFISRLKKPISRIAIWKRLKYYSKIANINKNIYPHILRHSFATHLIMNGADLRFVQELLGHSSIVTTEIYTQIDYRHLKEMYENYIFNLDI